MRKVTGRAGVVGLTVFLAVDVVLVGMALGSTHGSGAPGGRVNPPAASTSPTSSGPSTSAPPTTTAATGTPKVAVAPAGVGLLAVDQTRAVRFVVGSCGQGGAVVEVTHDGGRTWSRRPGPFDTVVRVRVRTDRSMFVVGANQSTGCIPAIRQAPSLDGAWGNPVAAGKAWYRDPKQPSRVGLAIGGTGTPCPSGPVVDLAVVDTGAAALCTSGDVLTSSKGAQWSGAGTVPGGLAVALGPGAQAYAVTTGVAACTGLAVVRSSAPTQLLGCVPVDPVSVAPGSVGFSLAADGGWVRVGTKTYRASPSLSDWKSV